MKKIGIIGGLAWPSTIDYYRLLCQGTNDYFKAVGHGLPYPSPLIVMESLNIAYTRSLRGQHGNEGSWIAFDDVFRTTFIRLKEAGAEFGIIASNTPHMRLEAITKGLDFPVISILDTTAIAVKKLGGRRALVLGTSVTMKSHIYPDKLKKHGIEAMSAIPEGVISELDEVIDKDLYHGQIAGARDKIANLSKRYIDDPSNDIVCLACTELPLAFPDHQNSSSFTENGISYVNTTAAHVEATLKFALTD